MRHIVNSVREDGVTLGFCIFLSLFIAAVLLVLPLAQKALLDDVVLAQTAENLPRLIASVSLAVLLLCGASVLQSRSCKLLAERSANRLRRRLMNGVFDLYDGRETSADRLSMFTNDLKVVADFVSAVVSDGPGQCLTAIGLVVGLIIFEWRIACYALACQPLVMISTQLFRRKIVDATGAWQRQVGKLTDVIKQQLDCTEEINVTGAQPAELVRLHDEGLATATSSAGLATVTSMSNSAASFVGSVANMGITWMAAAFVLQGRFSPGFILTLSTYMSMLSGPVQYFVRMRNHVVLVRKVVERLEPFWSVPPLGADAPAPREWNSADCGLSCQVGDRLLFRDLRLAIEKGKVIAIVGGNGTGKTTLLRLLTGVLQPSSGLIRVDGETLTKEVLGEWRRSIAYVPQQPGIIGATVRENLKLGNPDYSDAAGIRALETLGISLPLDSALSTLSGGERKAVALARAMLRNPRLMILDEPESHLDDAHRSRLIGYLREAKAEVAIVAVTHSPEIVELADEVISIECWS